jgi:[acyl-carrier-protein] S-malonyltransferase
MSIAFLFPGQGSQYVGMGKSLSEVEAARRTYREADRVLGWDLSKLCFEGPEAQLNQTEYTQPALLVTSVAVWRCLGEPIGRAAYVAGHSLGEYTALVASGALSFSDAVSLVHRRGRFMQEAVPPGQGGMAAIVGLSREAVEALCRKASNDSGKVTAANYNGPDQIVIAGETEAVKRGVALALEAGAKRAIPLAVSVPSHSPMMKEACIRLGAELEKISGKEPAVPLINNLHAKPIRTWQEAKLGLVDQLSSPLLWEETIQRMRNEGVDLFIEVGPGRVLSGLAKRIDRKLEVMNVEDPASLEKVAAVLSQKSS